MEERAPDASVANYTTLRRNSVLYSNAFLYFETVARCGSVRQAAGALNISPSAISHQISALETELGTPLLERLPKGVRTTSAGEILLHHLRRASSELERGRAGVERLTGLRTGDLTIATHEGLAISPLSETLTEYWEQSPNIRVSVLIGDEKRTVDAVVSGEAELGLGYFDRPDTRISPLLKIRVRLGAVMAPEHPLASRQSIRLSELADIPILTPGASIALPKEIDLYFKTRSLKPFHRLSTNSMGLIQKLANLNLGIGLKGKLGGTGAETANGSLVFVPIEDLDRSSEVLTFFSRPDSPLTPAAEAFARLMQKTLLSLADV